VGVTPKNLSDEHLRAENVELQMLIKFIFNHPKGNVPMNFTLGRGHISFFRNKFSYVYSRLNLIQYEMLRRNMCVNVTNTHIYEKIKDKLNIVDNINYIPSVTDVNILKERLLDRIQNPLKKTNSFHYALQPTTKEHLIQLLES
jgi:hypothetical protein